MGLRTRLVNMHYSVLQALSPWAAFMELARVKMPPTPFRGTVVADKLSIAMSAVPAATFGKPDVDVELCRLDVQPRSLHL